MRPSGVVRCIPVIFHAIGGKLRLFARVYIPHPTRCSPRINAQRASCLATALRPEARRPALNSVQESPLKLHVQRLPSIPNKIAFPSAEYSKREKGRCHLS